MSQQRQPDNSDKGSSLSFTAQLLSRAPTTSGQAAYPTEAPATQPQPHTQVPPPPPPPTIPRSTPGPSEAGRSRPADDGGGGDSNSNHRSPASPLASALSKGAANALYPSEAATTSADPPPPPPPPSVPGRGPKMPTILNTGAALGGNGNNNGDENDDNSADPSGLARAGSQRRQQGQTAGPSSGGGNVGSNTQGGEEEGGGRGESHHGNNNKDLTIDDDSNPSTARIGNPPAGLHSRGLVTVLPVHGHDDDHSNQYQHPNSTGEGNSHTAGPDGPHAPPSSGTGGGRRASGTHDGDSDYSDSEGPPPSHFHETATARTRINVPNALRDSNNNNNNDSDNNSGSKDRSDVESPLLGAFRSTGSAFNTSTTSSAENPGRAAGLTGVFSSSNNSNNNNNNNTNARGGAGGGGGSTGKGKSGGAGSDVDGGYHRIVVEGDAGDADYVKCAETIASVVLSRQSYKGVDKGQKETMMTADELEQLFRNNIDRKPDPVEWSTAASPQPSSSAVLPTSSLAGVASAGGSRPPLSAGSPHVTVVGSASVAGSPMGGMGGASIRQGASSTVGMAPLPPAASSPLHLTGATATTTTTSSSTASPSPAGTGAGKRTGPMRGANLVTPDGQPFLTFDKGVYRFHGMRTEHVTWAKYVKDIRAVYGAIENGPCLSTARTRLNALAQKFELYSLLNSELESSYDDYVRGGGVYARCTRVDNCIHLKTSVPAPAFLDFISRVAVDEPHTPLFVVPGTGPGGGGSGGGVGGGSSVNTAHASSVRNEEVELLEYLEKGGVVNPQEITIEGLGLHPTLYRNKFLPYDMFSETLNPSGAFGAKLLQAVLSTNGPNDGDLCGTLVRKELESREFRRRQVVATETSLELFGHSSEEVSRLAAWVRRQGFNNFERNRWILSVSTGKPYDGPNSLPPTAQTVGDVVRNVFYPLIMATLYVRDPVWQDVAQMLAHTSAISVETQPVTRTQNFFSTLVDPDTIRVEAGCSEYYLLYFLWNNFVTLNALRRRLGLNTLKFNTAVREPAPAFDQLVCGFLLGDVVYDVSSLHKSWIMQYLYVYCGVGVVMSPLADNVRSTAYFDHPIVNYFKQGMRVSLATSDPLYFHHRTEQPLLEEYATLFKLRSLTPMDLCELARNSVVNSNFPLERKQEWLGQDFTDKGDFGNDITRSGVCRYRLQYRHECLVHEEALLNAVLEKAAKKGTTPTTVSVVPFSESIQLADVVEQTRNARRINYTDHRIVYPRIDVYGGYSRRLATEAVSSLRQVLLLRKKYAMLNVVDVEVEDVFVKYKSFDEDVWEYNNYYGVFLLSRVGKSPAWPSFIPTIKEFMRDVDLCRTVVSSAALRRLAVHRLNLLERKFLLHLSINVYTEAGEKKDKEWNNRDFFTAHKVDNNVFTDAGVNARTLLEFFLDKAQNHGEDVVFEEDNSPVTLRQLVQRLAINTSQITVDELNHQISSNAQLRTIFLSPHNFMQGRYFAELTKKTLQIYKEDAFVFAENRLTLQGESPNEWYELAHWFDRYGMASSQNRWIISIPRSYRRLKRQGKVHNFGQFLTHIFKPLWEISLHPASDTKFHYFLAHTSGFDCCDDESKIDLPLSDTYPHDWNSELNPPYNMYLYYIWANLASLNEFRASRGLGTFSFRPQCGERGGADHLIGGFLLTYGISHGVTLAQHPALEYMYYIAQIGVAMSPLSNTSGASAYLENPFPVFFHRGLNVSLCTNKPLYFHFTREPLVEEYSIAAKLWKFEFNDMSEIARNSVLQSGYPPTWKEHALGPLYQLRSTLGNDVRRSRVSDVRVAYRYEVYHTELNFLDVQLEGSGAGAGLTVPRAMRTLEEEAAIYQDYVFHKQAAEQIRYSELPGGKDGATEEEEASSSTASASAAARRGSLLTQRRLSASAASASAAAALQGGNAGSRSSSLRPLGGALAQAAQTEELQADMRRLEAQLRQLTAVSEQISAQNSTMAEEVNALRERLRTEGYVLNGNLETSARYSNRLPGYYNSNSSPTSAAVSLNQNSVNNNNNNGRLGFRTGTGFNTDNTNLGARPAFEVSAFEFSISGQAYSRPSPPHSPQILVKVPPPPTQPASALRHNAASGGGGGAAAGATATATGASDNSSSSSGSGGGALRSSTKPAGALGGAKTGRRNQPLRVHHGHHHVPTGHGSESPVPEGAAAAGGGGGGRDGGGGGEGSPSLGDLSGDTSASYLTFHSPSQGSPAPHFVPASPVPPDEDQPPPPPRLQP